MVNMGWENSPTSKTKQIPKNKSNDAAGVFKLYI